MSISENKRVVALSAVFALAFGGIAFYGYGKSQELAESKARIAEINDRFAGYDGQDLAPTKKNLKAILVGVAGGSISCLGMILALAALFHYQ